MHFMDAVDVHDAPKREVAMAGVVAELQSTPSVRGPSPLVSVSAAEVEFGEVLYPRKDCAPHCCTRLE
jgi:hypothetical protein